MQVKTKQNKTVLYKTLFDVELDKTKNAFLWHHPKMWNRDLFFCLSKIALGHVMSFIRNKSSHGLTGWLDESWRLLP